MSESCDGESNWNVVQFHVMVLPGVGDEPGKVLIEREFADGGFTFEQCRQIVDVLIRRTALSPTEAVVRSGMWRSARTASEVAFGEYGWAIFQHGKTPQDGVEVVMQRIQEAIGDVEIVVSRMDELPQDRFPH